MKHRLQLIGWLSLMIIAALLLRHRLAQAQGVAHAQSCLANMKPIQLGLAAFVNDHQGRFALKAAAFKDALLKQGYPPKAEAVYHCVLDTTGASSSYSFNPYLEGVAANKINDPNHAIMVYEGQNKRLSFRHEGRCAVGCVNGVPKLYMLQEAKLLKWQP